MPKQIPLDYISAALEIATNITGIVEKALPSEELQMARFNLNKVKKLARAGLKADQLNYRRIKLRIDMTLLGLDIAEKEGLDKDLLKKNLQKLVEMLSEAE